MTLELEQAAIGGDAEAMYILGKELVTKAVNQGVANYQESYNKDLRKTFAEGIDWLNRAAENNSVDAIIELANLYVSGEINDGRNPEWDEVDEYEDLEQALKLYEKAHKIEPNDNFLKAINRIQDELEVLSAEREIQEQNQNE